MTQLHNQPSAILRTKPGEKILRKPLSFFGRSKTGQLYFVEIAQRFSASAIPVAYQMASDHFAPRVSAPVLKETGSQYYVSTQMLLEQYQKKVLRNRKDQLQAIKDKEFQDKLIALADAGVSALALVIPYLRIGELLVTTLSLTAASMAVHLAQGIHGSQEATKAIFQEDVLGLLMEAGLREIMPGWARFAFDVNEKASAVYKTYECKDNPKKHSSSDQQVPADTILDQIYRFRCVVDPKLPQQIESAMKNNQTLMAAILAWR